MPNPPLQVGGACWIIGGCSRELMNLKCTLLGRTRGERVMVQIAQDQPRAGSRFSIGKTHLSTVNPFLKTETAGGPINKVEDWRSWVQYCKGVDEKEKKLCLEVCDLDFSGGAKLLRFEFPSMKLRDAFDDAIHSGIDPPEALFSIGSPVAWVMVSPAEAKTWQQLDRSAGGLAEAVQRLLA